MYVIFLLLDELTHKRRGPRNAKNRSSPLSWYDCVVRTPLLRYANSE